MDEGGGVDREVWRRDVCSAFIAGHMKDEDPPTHPPTLDYDGSVTCFSLHAVTTLASITTTLILISQERQAFLEPYKHYKQFRDAGGQLCLEEFADAREVWVCG